MDPQMMLQISQGLQRLPKGQLQRLQAIMQKAMNGKDVTAEAQELERSLPKDFQEMMQSLSATYGNSMLQKAQQTAAAEEGGALPAPASEEPLSLEQARALVAKAAAEGKISQEQAQALLNSEDLPSQEVTPIESTGEATGESKLGRFWKNFSGKQEK
jgi:hypothetical protein